MGIKRSVKREQNFKPLPTKYILYVQYYQLLYRKNRDTNYPFPSLPSSFPSLYARRSMYVYMLIGFNYRFVRSLVVGLEGWTRIPKIYLYKNYAISRADRNMSALLFPLKTTYLTDLFFFRFPNTLTSK